MTIEYTRWLFNHRMASVLYELFPSVIKGLIETYMSGPITTIMTAPEKESYPFRLCLCLFCRSKHYRIISSASMLNNVICDNCFPKLWDMYQVCGKCLIRVGESDDYQCLCHNTWTPSQREASRDRLLSDREIDSIAKVFYAKNIKD